MSKRVTKTKHNNAKPSGVLTDDKIIDRAKDWAHLHECGRYSEMDRVIAGLSEKDSRRVILCGQRIRGGLKPKIAT